MKFTETSIRVAEDVPIRNRNGMVLNMEASGWTLDGERDQHDPANPLVKRCILVFSKTVKWTRKP